MEQKIEKLADWLDGKLPFKKIVGGIIGLVAEAVDGKFFAALFRYAVSKVDPEDHPKIEAALDAVFNEDYEALKALSTEELVRILKTPLGDEAERIFIAPQMDVIGGYIEYVRRQAIKAQGDEKEDDSVGGGGPGGDPDDGK